VALADVGDRGRVTVATSLDYDGEAASITNLVFDANDSHIYFATSDGVLRALSVTETAATTVGDVGVGAWSLALYAPTGRLAVVNAVQTDEDGNVLDAGGVTLTSIGGSAAKSAGLGGGSTSKLPSGPDHISRPGGRSGEH
jgi:hypothetical protein